MTPATGATLAGADLEEDRQYARNRAMALIRAQIQRARAGKVERREDNERGLRWPHIPSTRKTRRDRP
jgi:hypothetical protein